MKFSTGIPGLTQFPGLTGEPEWTRDISAADISTVASAADDLGYDYLVVPWHMAMAEGEWEANMGRRWPHSLAATGVLLGATRRLKVLCLVVVPCHHPVELAKAFATLDWMSGGRVIPVLMTGYMEWEYELLGVPFARRGARADEYTEAMIELWTADSPAYHGEFVSFDGIAFEPKPVQDPMPLWFGGSARSRRALDRVARWGSGWMSYASRHAEHPAAIERIHDDPDYHQRGRPDVEVAAYFVEPTHDQYTHEQSEPPKPVVGNDAIVERLDHLTSLGITATGAPLTSRDDGHGRGEPIRSLSEHLERLEWFATEIMSEARS